VRRPPKMVSPADDRAAPLAGTRVVDLTTFLSGPVAARTLADLGAEVVRVESPRGDPTRAGSGLRPGDPPSAFYLALHRDRYGVVLDLKTEAGVAVLRDLVAASDVLLETFSPGVPVSGAGRVPASNAESAAASSSRLVCQRRYTVDLGTPARRATSSNEKPRMPSSESTERAASRILASRSRLRGRPRRRGASTPTGARSNGLMPFQQLDDQSGT
jgi:hypothetical protein